jgi:hypothetical protein
MAAALVELLAALAAASAELLYGTRGVVAGWRYLFSRSYRERTHARWRHRSSVYAAVEIVYAVVACALSLLLLHVVISIFAGWNWWARLFTI